MKNSLIKPGRYPFVVTLLSAMLVSCVIVFVTLKWLDAYTLHNKAIIVPDVKGLQLEEASRFLLRSGLRYNVIDSVFSKEVRPGAIVEVVPSVGSKVKEGRIVFITLNALSSQMAAIPVVTDMSFRQAYALLKARGFESVEIAYVSGAYKDLAVGVELHGRLLEGNEMVQLTAPLILKVSNGMPDIFMGENPESDELPAADPSLQSSNSDAETWF
ncbi:MAG: PASTA domain-containing protein [Tannerellaceae bacterium]|jgi:beta-lactam-binding protein with PASTA domain|nr:PASTA domain-containing protein [Tannerellaceae bacterium]